MGTSPDIRNGSIARCRVNSGDAHFRGRSESLDSRAAPQRQKAINGKAGPFRTVSFRNGQSI